jgi:hypothetical protein
MSRRSVAVGVALSVVLLLASTVASAAVVVVFKVPFSFMVKDKELPAGRYEIREAGPDLEQVEVENLETGGVMTSMVMTRLADTGAKTAEVVFDKAEGKYYLSEFRDPGLDGVAIAGAPGKHTHERITGTTKR